MERGMMVATDTNDTRRLIDGRTLMVMVRWAMVIIDDNDNAYGLSAQEHAELQGAVDNVKYAMERVRFLVPEGVVTVDDLPPTAKQRDEQPG